MNSKILDNIFVKIKEKSTKFSGMNKDKIIG